MTQALVSPRGLVTDPAPAQAVDGALATASNVDVRRPGLVEPRFGHGATDAAPATGSDVPRKLFAYAGKVWAHTSNNKLESSTGGAAWTAITTQAAADPPDTTRYRVAAASSRKNLYLALAQGLETLTGASDTTSHRSGRWRPNMGFAATNAAVPAVYNAGDVFVYRVTELRRDANDLVVEGPPSGRIYYYDAGASSAVQVTVYLDDAVAGDVLCLYRQSTRTTQQVSQVRSSLDRARAFDSRPYYNSADTVGLLTGGAVTSDDRLEASGVPVRLPPPAEPDDNLFLVKEYTITSADVSAGFATIVDTIDDESLGRLLYTSPGAEGIRAAHDCPPTANVLTEWSGCLWGGNIKFPHRLTLDLLKVSGPNWANGADGIGYSTGRTGTMVNGSAVVTGVSSTTNVEAGQIIVSTRFAAGTTVASVDSGTQITASANANNGAGTDINFHDQLNIGNIRTYAAAATSTSVGSFECDADDATKALNALAYVFGNSSGYAAIASGVRGYPIVTAREAARGTLVLEQNRLGGAQFAVAGTRRLAWQAKIALPTDGTGTLLSTDDALLNGVAWSNPYEPEHWPLRNTVKIGDDLKRVLALVPCGDTLLVFKEDGTWAISGSFPNWRVDLVDPALRLLHPEAVCVYRGSAVAWTNQGVVAVSPGGVRVLSEPIRKTLRDLESRLALYPASSFGVWMVPYETAGQIQLGVPSAASQTTSAVTYVWHEAGGAWTTHTPTYACAVWNPADDLVYYGSGSTNTVYRTRRNYGAAFDHYDAAVAVTISQANPTSVLLSGSVSYTAGDAFIQGTKLAIITGTGSGTTVPIDADPGFAAAAATLARAFESSVIYQDVSLGNPLAQKLFWEANFNFEDLTNVRSVWLGFASDLTASYGDVEYTRTRDSAADPDAYRVGIPVAAARCTRLRPSVYLRQAGARWALGEIALSYDLETERVRRT